MIRIFWIKSIYDSCIKSVTEAICDSYSKHESRSFAHVYQCEGDECGDDFANGDDDSVVDCEGDECGDDLANGDDDGEEY